MTQPATPQVTSREEERVLAISYDRAVAMIPKLAETATGAQPTALGDGYYVVKVEHPNGVREVTIRLGRQGADTRFSVRVDTIKSLPPKITILVVVFGLLTFGLGVLAFLPWLVGIQRREARERELLVHKTFRAIEDAVAEQGVAGGYRIGPGADAASPATRVATGGEAEPLSEPVAAERERSL
jgi:hypothetical protein